MSELVDRRTESRRLEGKLTAHAGPLLEIQILIRCRSTVPGRAELIAQRLVGCFDQLAGENHLRAHGHRIPGLGFTGADAPWRRRRFDRRIHTGLFGPAQRSLVTAREIAGLLCPPTAHCHAPNIDRTVVLPVPAGLPSWAPGQGLIPLGEVDDDQEGRRVIGVRAGETFFSYLAGRSRYGKTETAVGQFLALVRDGEGGLFLDPHEDALEVIKAHLTDPELAGRVLEVNLAGRHATQAQPGWNLLAAQGLSREQAAARVDAVVDAFASALGWEERNTRALNLTTQAARALIDLAQVLPAELAPTVFQIPTLLSDDTWRAAVLPHVGGATRQFFEERFARLAIEAITSVTNLIDRLRGAPAIAALLGTPVSTYDIRAAMDQGLIVLACPGAGSTTDRLVANFLVYDLLHAAKARAHVPPERRRAFWVFLDEVQTYDGATSGNLAALLEQTAKYGVRAFLLNQNPERLTPATLNAVTTNRSHLATTALNAKGAALIAREWASHTDPATITTLGRHTFLASVTNHGQTTPPFVVHGVPVSRLHGDAHRPNRVGDVAQAVAERLHLRPVEETLAALEQHDQRILDHLTTTRRTNGTTEQSFARPALPTPKPRDRA